MKNGTGEGKVLLVLHQGAICTWEFNTAVPLFFTCGYTLLDRLISCTFIYFYNKLCLLMFKPNTILYRPNTILYLSNTVLYKPNTTVGRIFSLFPYRQMGRGDYFSVFCV